MNFPFSREMILFFIFALLIHFWTFDSTRTIVRILFARDELKSVNFRRNNYFTVQTENSADARASRKRIINIFFEYFCSDRTAINRRWRHTTFENYRNWIFHFENSVFLFRQKLNYTQYEKKKKLLSRNCTILASRTRHNLSERATENGERVRRREHFPYQKQREQWENRSVRMCGWIAVALSFSLAFSGSLSSFPSMCIGVKCHPLIGI